MPLASVNEINRHVFQFLTAGACSGDTFIYPGTDKHLQFYEGADETWPPLSYVIKPLIQ